MYIKDKQTQTSDIIFLLQEGHNNSLSIVVCLLWHCYMHKPSTCEAVTCYNFDKQPFDLSKIRIKPASISLINMSSDRHVLHYCIFLDQTNIYK